MPINDCVRTAPQPTRAATATHGTAHDRAGGGGTHARTRERELPSDTSTHTRPATPEGEAHRTLHARARARHDYAASPDATRDSAKVHVRANHKEPPPQCHSLAVCHLLNNSGRR
jgi:hypothetical protein